MLRFAVPSAGAPSWSTPPIPRLSTPPPAARANAPEREARRRRIRGRALRGTSDDAIARGEGPTPRRIVRRKPAQRAVVTVGELARLQSSGLDDAPRPPDGKVADGTLAGMSVSGVAKTLSPARKPLKSQESRKRKIFVDFHRLSDESGANGSRADDCDRPNGAPPTDRLSGAARPERPPPPCPP